MKRLLAYYCKVGMLILGLLEVSFPLIAQCPENLFISTPEQLALFSREYPNCNEISGNVIIEGFGTNRMRHLDGLQQIQKISGSLFIGNHLSLNDLSALQNLEGIGKDVTIINNPSLMEISSFSKLVRIGGTLKIVNCQQLEQLYFPELEFIGSDFTIFYNIHLKSLKGLGKLKEIGGDLKILRNSLIASLQGLDNLTAIQQDLVVYGNTSLVSLAALNKLQEVNGRIVIVENSALSDCTGGFCYRYQLGNQLVEGYIKDNACGCNQSTEIRTSCLGDTVNCNPTYTIAGSIHTPVYEPLNNVMIRLSGEVEDSIVTDTRGIFRFEGLPKGEYYITPIRENDYANGVTIVDVSIILNYVNGNLSLLDDPYKVLAADIDQSKSITMEDAELVKQLAQGSIAKWDKVSSWGFINSAVDFENEVHEPWSVLDNVGVESDRIHISELGKDYLSIHFIGYKYGDVNNSSSP